MSYRAEFPRFDHDLPVGLFAALGYEDTSWHNDTMPSFAKLIGPYRIGVWCNYTDPALRDDDTAPAYIVALEYQHPDREVSEYYLFDQSCDTLDKALDIADWLTADILRPDRYVVQYQLHTEEWIDVLDLPEYLTEEAAQQALIRRARYSPHHYRVTHTR